jgi:lipopolysaccharide/colanic/teichoic acid biosynthesis glycosyltransferase/GNAT superfamily N-acetyltransferase
MYKHFFKRILDFVISLIALICISPILLVVTIWLHFANKKGSLTPDPSPKGKRSNWLQRWLEPAIFLQERPGKDAKIFKVIKFKTMTDEVDANGELLPDADRLTKVGKIVRSTSIDELPQLINVLKGDMALIGPRPLLVKYLPYYSAREKMRHSVRPGITGWAQVNGRNTVDWDNRLALDVYYVEHLTLLMDLRIVAMTIKNVINRSDIVVVPNNMFEDLDVERSEKITLDELKQSLHEIDKDFVPNLSERVDIDEYAERMMNRAKFMIERDQDAIIKGIVAVYIDDEKSPNGFVTHVATNKKYRNQGVAKRLMIKTMDYCKKAGKTGIDLYTYNPIALDLYQNMGFEIVSQSPNDEWHLHKTLN